MKKVIEYDETFTDEDNSINDYGYEEFELDRDKRKDEDENEEELKIKGKDENKEIGKGEGKGKKGKKDNTEIKVRIGNLLNKITIDAVQNSIKSKNIVGKSIARSIIGKNEWDDLSDDDQEIIAKRVNDIRKTILKNK